MTKLLDVVSSEISPVKTAQSSPPSRSLGSADFKTKHVSSLDPLSLLSGLFSKDVKDTFM